MKLVSVVWKIPSYLCNRSMMNIGVSSITGASDARNDDLKPILTVGLICVDIINLCDEYPREDGDIRAKGQRWQHGGNACNTSVVLATLGRRCELLATLGSGMETDFALKHLNTFGISHGSCVLYPSHKLPTSCVVLNTTNGSRTIVHYSNLPELTLSDFTKINVSEYSWIHFEGRNPLEYVKMIRHVMASNETRRKAGEREITVSVELEKNKPNVGKLLPLGDVVIVSRLYATLNGYHSAEEAALGFREKAKDGAVVVCAWGEVGAAACDSSGKVFSCPAYPPPAVVDTLGAGDTFNAGLIHSLARGNGLETALKFACKLAGAKCGFLGYEQLRNFESN